MRTVSDVFMGIDDDVEGLLPDDLMLLMTEAITSTPPKHPTSRYPPCFRPSKQGHLVFVMDNGWSVPSKHHYTHVTIDC
jgi:hypothetical protein